MSPPLALEPRLAQLRLPGLVLGALAIVGASAGLVASLTGASLGPDPTFGDRTAPASLLLFGAVGTLIVARRPGHPFGFLLVAFTALMVAGGVGQLVITWDVAPALVDVVSWVSSWSWVPAITVLASGLLTFPDGRLPSRRWRVLGAVHILALALSVALAVSLWPHRGPALVGVEDAWPGAASTVGGVLLPVMSVAFVGAVVSLIVRFRTASDVVRLQLKWLLLAVALLALALIGAATSDVLGVGSQAVQDVLGVAGLFVLPVSLGVAVLRYRLFEIDRIIGRVVAYTVVTAVLAGVYAAGVLGVGGLVPGGSSDLLVAASTLVVAALFQPVRRRVQALVDRRFNRARYDAQQVVAGFAGRLRSEVELGRLTDQLQETVDRVVQPSSVSLVLVGGPPGERS